VSDRNPRSGPLLADTAALGPLGILIPEGERTALAYARAHPEPFTADGAARALGSSRAAMRRRLERLEALGLLRSEFRRLGARVGPGAGRPAKLYRAAPEVDAREFPAHRLTGLLRLLLEDTRPDEPRLRRLGQRFASVLSPREAPRHTSDLGQAADRVCSDLARLGYVARVATVARDEVVLEVPTCPLRPLVCEAPETSEIDRGLWEGLVAQAGGSGLVLHCLTDRCLESNQDCTVTVRLGGGGSP
jgi:predicted ArsR family transcriptional regulator